MGLGYRAEYMRMVFHGPGVKPGHDGNGCEFFNNTRGIIRRRNRRPRKSRGQILITEFVYPVWDKTRAVSGKGRRPGAGADNQ